MRRLSLWPRAIVGLSTPVLLVTLFVFTVRLTSGPFGPIPGGALEGTLVHERHPDWQFTDHLKYVHLQINTNLPKSLEMLCVRKDDDLYVGANFPDQKDWPSQIVQHPNVVVGVQGDLYPRHAVRIVDEKAARRLLAAMNEKYGFDVSMGTGVVQFFRLDPASEAL